MCVYLDFFCTGSTIYCYYHIIGVALFAVCKGGINLEHDDRKVSWGILEFVLAFGGIYILGLAYAILNQRPGGVASWFGIANTDFNAFSLAFIVRFIGAVLLIWLFTVWINHASWRDLGVKKTSARNFLVYGLFGGVALLGLVLLISLPISYLQPDIKPQDLTVLLKSAANTKAFLLLLVMASVLAPFYEELLFRGMLYPVLRRYLGVTGGAIVAGAIFGLAHWDLWRTIPLAIGGAFLCYIYEKTGSILVSALAHGVWNGILAVIIYFTVLPMV